MKNEILAAWAKAYDEAIQADNTRLAAFAYIRYIRALGAK